jgi:hypothetical protein
MPAPKSNAWVPFTPQATAGNTFENMAAAATARRELLIDGGEKLRDIIYDRGALGSVAEVRLQYSDAALIVGGYGYLGIIDHDRKIVFDFQMGSRTCSVGFQDAYGSYDKIGYKLQKVPNDRFFGKGDDSMVIACLEDYRANQTVQAALSGDYSPKVLLKRGAMSDREYEARKWMGVADEPGTDPLAAALLLFGAVKEVGLVKQFGPEVGTEINWKERYEQAKTNGRLGS